jgi:ATP-dependent Clp protease ATP-binding subunit ClpA
MFERFGKDAKTVVIGARDEAASRGAATLDAEHMLLALAKLPDSAAGSLLAQAGLDYENVERALEMEFEQSLACAGVPLGMFKLGGTRTIPHAGTPIWGTSAKLVFKRAHASLKARGGRVLTPVHLLLGIVAAEVGTVPRALRVVGVDREELARSAANTLA